MQPVCQEALDSPMKDALNKLGLGKLTYLGDRLEADADAAVLQGVDSLGRQGDHQSRKAFICGGNDSPLRGRRLLLLSEGRRSGRLLDLCVVNNVPRWKFPIIIPFALKGKHGGFKGVDQYRASRIEIRTSTPCWVQTDGEIPGKLDRIELTVEKQKIRFIV